MPRRSQRAVRTVPRTVEALTRTLRGLESVRTAARNDAALLGSQADHAAKAGRPGRARVLRGKAANRAREAERVGRAIDAVLRSVSWEALDSIAREVDDTRLGIVVDHCGELLASLKGRYRAEKAFVGAIRADPSLRPDLVSFAEVAGEIALGSTPDGALGTVSRVLTSEPVLSALFTEGQGPKATAEIVVSALANMGRTALADATRPGRKGSGRKPRAKRPGAAG